tara:strand:+ start:636 stop:791 length:156 start_codon:yes stop_codon:yes gene_type:complete
MAQLGSEKDPIRMSARRTSKIRGRFLKNEDRKRYSNNYDKIFNSKSKNSKD